MLRRTFRRLGGATSNALAPEGSGRWFNPPRQWTVVDVAVSIIIPVVVVTGLVFPYIAIVGPVFSHYIDKNYYPTQMYTKEFIHKYHRLERWRWY